MNFSVRQNLQSGSQEVRGSIPLISTIEKDRKMGTFRGSCCIYLAMPNLCKCERSVSRELNNTVYGCFDIVQSSFNFAVFCREFAVLRHIPRRYILVGFKFDPQSVDFRFKAFYLCL